MPTDEQRKAVRTVAEAIQVLNRAMSAASDAGVHIELIEREMMGSRNAHFIINTSETRETVLP